MANWKTNTAVVLGTAGLVFGVLGALGPQEQNRNIRTVDQQLGDLADSHETTNDRLRDQGTDGIHAENSEKLHPREHRPPHIRIRLP